MFSFFISTRGEEHPPGHNYTYAGHEHSKQTNKQTASGEKGLPLGWLTIATVVDQMQWSVATSSTTRQGHLSVPVETPDATEREQLTRKQ